MELTVVLTDSKGGSAGRLVFYCVVVDKQQAMQLEADDGEDNPAIQIDPSFTEGFIRVHSITACNLKNVEMVGLQVISFSVC